MDLSPAEQLVFSYFVANNAQDFNMVGRWWPYGELVLVVEDKIRIATRKFGFKADLASAKAARAFLDLLIERGAFSSKESSLGGIMHQYQTEAYKSLIAELQAGDPLIQKAGAEGPDVWKDAFAAL